METTKSSFAVENNYEFLVAQITTISYERFLVYKERWLLNDHAIGKRGIGEMMRCT